MSSKTKPAATEISKARESSKRHHKTAGEKLAVAPRPAGTPTKKRPAGGTGLTWNLDLEKPPTPPPARATRQKPENLRVGKRKPKAARSVRRTASAKKH